MAYLPGGVLEQLKKIADKGGKYAEELLKKNGSGGGDKKEEQPSKPSAPATPTITQILNNQAQQQQQTVQPNVTWQPSTNTEEQKKHNEQYVQKQTEEVVKLIESNRNKYTFSEKREKDTKAKAWAIKENAKQVNKDNEPADVLDLQAGRFMPCAKYNVQTVNAGNAEFILGDNVKIISVVDGTGLHKDMATEDEYNIGRNSLVGAQKGADYVLYNTETGELYQYAQDSDVNKSLAAVEKSGDVMDRISVSYEQRMADYNKQMELISNEYNKFIEDNKINPETDELTDEQLSYIQDIIERYSKIEAEMEQDTNNTSKRYSLENTKYNKLQDNIKGNGIVDVSTYSNATFLIQRYEDMQDVFSNKLSAAAFREKYGYLPTVDRLNNAAVEAKEAQSSLHNWNGLLYDRDGSETARLNGIVSERIANEDTYNNTVKNGALVSADRLNMTDDKAVNSLTDWFRFRLVDLMDGVKYKDRAVNAFKDACELATGYKNEFLAGDNENFWDVNNMNTGLSGIILNELNDGGNILLAWVNTLYNAKGFQGKHTTYLSGGREAASEVTRFKEGKLLNEDYYMNKADLRDNLEGVDRVKQYWKAVGLAYEAQLRGDISGNFNPLSDSNTQTLVTTNGLTKDLGEFADKHPIQASFWDIAFNMACDPSTWVGNIKGARTKEVDKIAKELASKQTDDFLKQATRVYGLSDDALEGSRKSVQKVFEAAVNNGDTVKNAFNEADNARAVKALLANKDVQNLQTIASLNKAERFETAMNACRKSVADVALNDATADMWKSAQSAIASVQDLKSLDSALNYIQTGALGVGGLTIKKTASVAKTLINTENVSDVMFKIAAGKNQLCYSLSKALGTQDLEAVNTIAHAQMSSTAIDLFDDAVRKGEDIPEHIISDLLQCDVDTRADHAAAIARDEIRKIASTLRETVPEGFYTTDVKGMSASELADYINGFGRRNVEQLDEITKQLYGKTYKEYIDYLYSLSDKLKTIDGVYIAKRPLSSVIDKEIARIERYCTSFNNRLMNMQVSMLYKALSEHSDESYEALMRLDLSDSAPDLKKAFDEVVQALVENRSIAEHNKELKAHNDMLREYNAFVQEWNAEVAEWNDFVSTWNKGQKDQIADTIAHNKRVKDWNASVYEKLAERQSEIDEYNEGVKKFYEERREFNEYVKQHNSKVSEWNATVYDLLAKRKADIDEFNETTAKLFYDNRREYNDYVTAHNKKVKEWNDSIREAITARNEEIAKINEAAKANNLEVYTKRKEYDMVMQFSEYESIAKSAQECIDAEDLAKARLSKIAEDYEGIVKANTEFSGNPYIPAFNPMKHENIKYATPKDYVEAAFRQAGVTPTQEQLDSIVKTGVKSFIKDNPELAGSIYVFKDSAECNLTGILNNKALEAIYDSDTLDIIDKAGYSYLVPDKRVIDSSREFVDNLSSFGSDTGLEYHAIMDTFSGSYDELNKLARAYNSTDSYRAETAYMHRMVELIKSGSDRFAKAGGHEIDWKVYEPRLRDALYAALDCTDESSTGIVCTRNSIYTKLSELAKIAESDEGLVDVSTDLKVLLNEAKYSSDNTELGSFISGDLLNKAIEEATGYTGFKTDHLAAIVDATWGGELSLGLRKVINIDVTSDLFSRDYVMKYFDADTLLTELNYYTRDLLDVNKSLDRVLYTGDDLNNMAKVINAECLGLNDPTAIRYLEHFNQLMSTTTDVKLKNAAVIDIVQRLDIRTDVWGFALDLPDVRSDADIFCGDLAEYIKWSEDETLQSLKEMYSKDYLAYNKDKFTDYVKVSEDEEYNKIKEMISTDYLEYSKSKRQYLKASEDKKYQKIKSLLSTDYKKFEAEWAQYRKDWMKKRTDFNLFDDFLKFKKVELPKNWSWRTELDKAKTVPDLHDVHKVLNDEAETVQEYVQMRENIRQVAMYARDTDARLSYLDARRAALEMFSPDDIEAVAQFEARANYYTELKGVYGSFNEEYNTLAGERLFGAVSEQIKGYKEAEKVMWDSNINRVLNMHGDELDAMLLQNGMNGIVCDVHDARITKWVADREKEGYIITHTQFAGNSVAVVSLDVQSLPAERIEFLKTAQFGAANVQRDVQFESALYGSKMQQRLADAYDFNYKHLGDKWANSAIGSRVQIDFYDELQSKLPVQCRLNSTFRYAHTDAYMSNMLVPSYMARQMGAVKGNILGSWYYSAVSAAEHTDAVQDMARCLNVPSNTLGAQLRMAGVDITDSATVQKMLKDGNYHIVDLAETFKAGDAQKLSYRLLDGQTDFTKCANAILLDDNTYKWMVEGVHSVNDAASRLTNPVWMQNICDVLAHTRSAYVTGMLYLSNFKGTSFRNVVDSNTKALAEIGINDTGEYFKHYATMVDEQASYVQTMGRVYEETGQHGIEAIYKYLDAHPEVDADQLAKWHTAFSLTGTADDALSDVYKVANNKLILNSLNIKVGSEDAKNINKAFCTVRDQWIRNNSRSDTEKYQAILKYLREYLKDSSLDNEQIIDIANCYGKWTMGNTEHWYTKIFNRDTLVGRALSAVNKTSFDNAEVRARNAMLMTMMDNGIDATSANARVIKTQFDYGVRTGNAVSMWDNVMPFAKYQFSNAAYWADITNYSSATTANMRRLTLAGRHIKQTADAVKVQFGYNYMKNKYGNEQTEVEPEQLNAFELFKRSLNDTIEDYKGTPSKYIDGLSVSDHRYIKIGNGMMDTYDWLNKVFRAPADLLKGEVPEIIQDTFFSPAKTVLENKDILIEFFKGNWDAKFDYDKYKDKSFYYNIMNLVPVFGNLANLCITAYKNVLANKTLLALANTDKNCKDNLLSAIGSELYSIGFGLFNSIVGLKYDSVKPIFVPSTDADGNKVTWSSLSEEEKAKYSYNPLISVDRSWETKPQNLYGMYGRLAQMGLTKSEINLLTDKTHWRNEAFYIDNDGNRYVNTHMLETVVYDMLEQGYTASEIAYLLTMNDRWYDLNTKTIIKGSSNLEQYMLSKGVLDTYSYLPDYIKYQPDMYKEMVAMYKALGCNTREAWLLMIADNAYIDENRQLRKLSADEAVAYEQWMKNEYFEGKGDDGFLAWYATLPDYIKYEKGAYSRTLAYLKQMFSAEEAKQMIANGAYYTADGRLINCTDLHRAHGKKNTAFQDAQGYWHKATDFQVNGYWFHEGDNPYLGYKDFNDYYKHLPQYTQFTKGCFKQTNQVLKEAGFDYNTRMQAMLDGAVAMEIDPNSETFKAYLAKQQIVAVTKTVYVDKQVPLRECTLVNGKWQWNGPQTVKVTNLGNGYTTEQVTKDMEFNAASMGVTQAAKWKSYDSAMVTVKVPHTVVTAEQDPDQIMYRIVTMGDKTYIIVPAPEYTRPRGGYYKKGSPKSWTKRRNYTRNYNNYEKSKRYKNYYGYNNKPMHIKYSNVRTYSKQHFLQQQSDGYKYWTQWGDGNMTNHRNRNGRMHYPSTYRNPRVKQRSIYKDIYAKYGASRINARQNIAGYSNASITRFRRNDIANRSYNIKVNSARI